METSQDNGTSGNHQNGVLPENGVAGQPGVVRSRDSGGAMEDDEEESREEPNSGDPE